MYNKKNRRYNLTIDCHEHLLSEVHTDKIKALRYAKEFVKNHLKKQETFEIKIIADNGKVFADIIGRVNENGNLIYL